jgi:hypothetical protein
LLTTVEEAGGCADVGFSTGEWADIANISWRYSTHQPIKPNTKSKASQANVRFS